MQLENYYQHAKKHESLFRAILQDLQINRQERPLGSIIPDKLETEFDIETIVERYSSGDRNDKFTILDFSLSSLDKAIISYEKINYLKIGGKGVEIRYTLSESGIKYEGELMDWTLSL